MVNTIRDHDGKLSSTRIMTVGSWIVAMGKWVIPPMMGVVTTETDASIITWIVGLACGAAVLKTGAEGWKKRQENMSNDV